jgi:hypothetical protein
MTERRREATIDELVTLLADESEYPEDTVKDILDSIDDLGGRVVDVTVVEPEEAD